MPSSKTKTRAKLNSDEDKTQKLRHELEQAHDKANDYLNRLTYLQAEFENYQKRVKREIAQTTHYGTLTLITKLLPIIDELEYALQAGDTESTSQGLIEGVKLILSKLKNILAKEGLTPINAIGKPFDPYQHEVIQRETNGLGQDLVTEEIRKGYMFKSKVIRPSLVKVATFPTNVSDKDE
jgi:molecular chaperone GrpE